MSFPPIFESILMLIGMLMIALLIDWQVTLVSLVCIPFLYWAIGLYGTRIVPRIQRVQSLEMRSLSIVFEAMTMLRVIVSFGRRRLRALPLHHAGQDRGRRARAADGPPDDVLARGRDRDRAGTAIVLGVRRLPRAPGQASAWAR